MAIVLQIRGAGSPGRQGRAAALSTEPAEVGCVTAGWHFTNDWPNRSLDRGLARIVQSWFFCFRLALPSPFRSRADVKGCEVTARGRYWVEVGRRGGQAGSARPSCRSAEFLLHLGRLARGTSHRGHSSVRKMDRLHEIGRNDRKRTSFKGGCFHAAWGASKRNMPEL